MNSSSQNPSRYSWLPLVVTGGLALVLRLIYFVTAKSSVLHTELRLDESAFRYWENGEVGRFGTGVNTALAPMIPTLLSWAQIFGDASQSLRLWNVLLSTLTVVLVADLARRWGGAIAAWVSGVLLACAWPVILQSGFLLESTTVVALLVSALWIVAKPTRSFALSLVAALCLGIAAFARPPFVILIVVTAFSVAGSNHGQRDPKKLVLWIVVALLPLLGLGVRNAVVGGQFLPGYSNLGIEIRAGLDPSFDGQSAALAEWGDDWPSRWHGARNAIGADVSNYRAKHMSDGFAAAISNPGGALGLLAMKLRFLLGDVSRGDTRNLQYWRGQDSLLSIFVLPSAAIFVGLGLVGLWFTRTRQELKVLRVFVLATAASCLMLFVNDRMRLPLFALLAIGAGLTVQTIIAAWRSGDRRALMTLLVASLLVTSASLADRLGDGSSEARDLGRHAGLLHSAGSFEEATNLYRSAIGLVREKPETDLARELGLGLVRALQRFNQLKDADSHLRLLETHWPEHPDVIAMRGRLFLAEHAHRRAFPHFRRVLDSHPTHVEALLGIAWCQVENKAYVPAESSFRKAISIGGPLGEAWAGIGVIEATAKRNHAGARIYFNHALRVDWFTPVAHQYIGEFYRADGDEVAAVYHFRQCLIQDRRNPDVSRFLSRAGINIEQLLADESIPRPKTP